MNAMQCNVMQWYLLFGALFMCFEKDLSDFPP